MPIIKLTLNNEYYEKLHKMAEAKNQSVQDYIRSVVFDIHTIFTPEEAVKRIQAGAVDHLDEFTLPDVYGDDWTIERGPAGVFGKNFYRFIEKHTELGIHFKDMGKYGRRATYTFRKKVNHVQQ